MAAASNDTKELGHRCAPLRKSHSRGAALARLLPLIAGGISSAAMAAGPLQVTSSVLVEQRVAQADGTTGIRLVQPGRVVPGDQVTLVLEYRNTAASPLSNVVLANPVPQGMAFRAVAPGTPAPEVSVDGTSFAALDRLTVRAADGARHPAVPADIVSVRWRLPAPVPAGGKGRLAFRAALK